MNISRVGEVDGARLIDCVAYVLRVTAHDGTQRHLRIDRERTVIGAARGHVQLDDPAVSPRHAEVLFRDGLVGVRDLASTGGTWVGGRRVQRAVLRLGSWFRVGRTTFELVDLVRPDAAEQPTRIVDAANAAPHGRDSVDRGVWSARGGLATSSGSHATMARRRKGGADRRMVDVDAVDAPPPVLPPSTAANETTRKVEVVVAEAEPARAAWLRQALEATCTCRVVTTGNEAVARVRERRGLVVVVGGQLTDMSPDALVAALGAPDVSGGVCVLAADDAVCCDASLYYRIPAGMSAPDLARVVASAAAPRTTALAPVATETAAWCSKIIFDICASVGLHVQPESAAAMLEDGLARLLPGARFACMFYDAQSGQLWRPCAEVELEAAASHGIVGFVARTGHAVHAPVAGRDPRYVREVDDPRGCGNEALLAVPAGAGAEIHAVLVVVRDPAQGAFDQKACDTLVQLASQVGPVLHRVAMASEVQQALDVLRRPNAMQIFRPEAIEAHQERKETGEVIRVSPAWARWMYWTIIGAITAVAIGSAVAEVSQYSTGAAVVRQDGRSELGAAGSGAVKRIEVEPGDVVERGQVLVRLSDVTERAAFDSTRDDFHAQLRTRLLDPTDEAAAQQLRALRRQLDAAQAELEHRVIRAPHDGIVTDIAVDVGQHVAAGDVVLAVVDEDAPGLEVIAFLPGEDRPQIELGMNLRLELSGFDYAYQDLQVESVSEGVVGGNEAKRIVGPQLADTLPLGGGVVMVRATLPAPTFESDGQTYPYHDGMAGTAEVRLRDETILEMLVPALKEL